MSDKMIIQLIKGALSTEEDEPELIEVARNAHRAEQKLAQLQRYADNMQWNKIKDYFGMPRGGT